MKSRFAFAFVSVLALTLSFASAFAESSSKIVDDADRAPRPCKAEGVQFCIKNAEGGYEWTDAVDFNPATCEAKLPADLEAAEPALCDESAAPF